MKSKVMSWNLSSDSHGGGGYRQSVVESSIIPENSVTTNSQQRQDKYGQKNIG